MLVINTISTIVTDHQANIGSIILNGYLDFPIEDTKWTYLLEQEWFNKC